MPLECPSAGFVPSGNVFDILQVAMQSPQQRE